MTQLSIVDAQRPTEENQSLSREAIAELVAKIDVLSRRVGVPRPARWVGAAIDVLTRWPEVPYTPVATMEAPGSSTFATAIVYEKCPVAAPEGIKASAQPKGVQLLIKRARDFGADAIILHNASGQSLGQFLLAQNDAA